MSRPFRFSVQAPGPPDATARRELARKAEDLGYSTLTMADHFDDRMAPVAGLMAAADATTTLRIGTLVFANDYRHPVVLAKEAATLDLLSEGRFELGLGAGWMTADYEQAGLTLDPAGVRVDRLTEAVTIVKGLLAGETVDFSGDHYRVTGLTGTPMPVQRPRPPLLIGGGGRRVLSLAGREADIVGVNFDMRAGRLEETFGPNGTRANTEQKLGWIREAAGDRFDDLELQVRVHFGAVTDRRDDLAGEIGPAFGLTPEEALGTPHALAGTVDQIVDDLVERRETFGVSYIGLNADWMDDFAPVVARLAGT